MVSKIVNGLIFSWNRLGRRQKQVIIVLSLLLFFVPHLVFASKIVDALLKILTGLLYLLVNALGKILALIIHVLVYVSQYNDFINEVVVVEGWKVVRDICNMFFVLGLLIIAFGTVLRLQNYQAKNNLKNFIFGAIFVNFSKTICGIIIDFAQIIMLTFVNGFKDIGSGNFVEMFGLTSLFEISSTVKDVSSSAMFVSYLMATFYLIIAIGTIITMLIMLIARAVMIWLFVVLSPFPYLLSALPKVGGLGNLSSQWWNHFTGLVITGPLLAFFIWLSFFTVTSNATIEDKQKIKLTGQTASIANPDNADEGEDPLGDVNAGVTDSTTAQAIIKFLVSIGILWGGITITKGTSSMLGGVVGGTVSKLKSYGKAGAKLGGKLAGGVTKRVAKKAGRDALKAFGAGTQALFKNSNSKVGQSFQKVGKLASSWEEDLTEKRKKEKETKQMNILKKMGMGEKSMEQLQNVADDDVVKEVGKFAKGAMFSKIFGKATKGMASSEGLAYEEARQNRDNKIEEAKNTMNSERDKAKKDQDRTIEDAGERLKNGIISQKIYNEIVKEAKAKYNKDEDIAIKKYDTAKENAIKEMHKEFGTIVLNNAKIAQADHEKGSKEWDKYQEKINKIEGNEEDYGEKWHNSFKNSWSRVSSKFGVNSALNRAGEKMENYHPFETIVRATKTFLKDSVDAKEKVEAMSIQDPVDLAREMIHSVFSGKKGALNNQQIQVWKQLASSENLNSQEAIDNLVEAVRLLILDDENDFKKLEALAQGLSTFEKNGGDTRRLSSLKSALANQGLDYDKYYAKAPKARLRELESDANIGEGDRSLRVNSFASGKHDVNMIGVDFSLLSQSLRDAIDGALAAGLNITPENIAEAASELIGIVDNELASLGNTSSAWVNEPLANLEEKIEALRNQRSDALKSGDGELAESSLAEIQDISKVRDLLAAKERLSKPEELKNLSLKNTAVSLPSARETVVTVMHEAFHGFGINSDQLAETVAQQMVGGGYKIDDVSTIAQRLKEIMTSNNLSEDQLGVSEIEAALTGINPQSSAQKVFAKQTGSQVIVDNSSVVDAIDDIADKISSGINKAANKLGRDINIGPLNMADRLGDKMSTSAKNNSVASQKTNEAIKDLGEKNKDLINELSKE